MTEAEAPKRKRRTRAEMEAARAGAAQAECTHPSMTESTSQTKHVRNSSKDTGSKDTRTPPNNVVAPGIPEPNGELMPDSIIRVFSFLAKSNVSPCVYTDACDLMGSCIEFKNTFKLSDDKFIELMHAFDPLPDKKK